MKFHATQILTIALILNCAIGLFCVEFPFRSVYQIEENSTFSGLFSALLVLSSIVTGYMLLQAILASIYRPVKTPSVDQLPTCTVLIPAFNEGKSVYDTIQSVLASDFPADKMEVIAIDDGSEDDTYAWLERAVHDFPGRVRALKQPVNGGKKKALCRGIAESANEIIVTVDSDSILTADSLKNLLAPFPKNPRIGAVAGTIRVKNLDRGIMPRMLDVAFVFGCEFIRSAQSVIGTVLCTPGAISGYRRSAILPLTETWLAQTFMHEPAKIGEDRALTSLLLRNSWKVVCQNNAIAYTEVPDRYNRLCRMLLRWTRGDIRESIMLLDYVTSKWSLRDWRWTLFQINVFSQIIGVLLPFVFIPCTVLSFVLFSDHLLFMFYYTFTMNGVWSLLPAAVYAKRVNLAGALWAFVYGVFSVIALSWICVYSLFTLRNSKWLTRGRA